MVSESGVTITDGLVLAVKWCIRASNAGSGRNPNASESESLESDLIGAFESLITPSLAPQGSRDSSRGVAILSATQAYRQHLVAFIRIHICGTYRVFEPR